jgi:hypothetical protein
MQYVPERAEAALRFCCARAPADYRYSTQVPGAGAEISMVSRSDRRFCRGALRTSLQLTSPHLTSRRVIPCCAGRHHLSSSLMCPKSRCICLYSSCILLGWTMDFASLLSLAGLRPIHVFLLMSCLFVRTQYPMSSSFSYASLRPVYFAPAICV